MLVFRHSYIIQKTLYFKLVHVIFSEHNIKLLVVTKWNMILSYLVLRVVKTYET